MKDMRILIHLVCSLFIHTVIGIFTDYATDFEWQMVPEPSGEWVGTPPYCDAEPEDCPNIDKFLGFRTSGAPDNEIIDVCWGGSQSYCTDYKVWDETKQYGTPPFCDADCNDCELGYECIATGRYGDLDVGGFEVCRWWFDNTERIAFCGKPVMSYQYLGCYSDSAQIRAFSESRGGGYTVATCGTACRGYEFFAIQGGSQCYCEDDLDEVSKYGQSTQCNGRLGGILANSVFRNYYRGCFQDNANNRALSVTKGNYAGFYDVLGGGIIIVFCRNMCLGYMFFAISDNGYCSCSNSFESATQYGQLSESQCSSDGVGGTMINSVYENFHCSQVFNSKWQSNTFFCLIAMQRVYIYKHQSSSPIIDNGLKLINSGPIKTNHKIIHWLLFIIIVAIFINVICGCIWCVRKWRKYKNKTIKTHVFDQPSDIEEF